MQAFNFYPNPTLTAKQRRIRNIKLRRKRRRLKPIESKNLKNKIQQYKNRVEKKIPLADEEKDKETTKVGSQEWVEFDPEKILQCH